ncbi:hypothetical protein KB891_17950 [Cupriavidus metallidurans]|uniref:Uncharacterized protein n=2 Tax=Burkholderiaceae TaxID=119060 RepID=A0A482J312_9BURK|nr:hypothetical protein DDF84_030480 [Cupriavidus metallidurans]QWC91649.1 hypothetical protein KB891_17950 [Cupriavidus metallidurans]
MTPPGVPTMHPELQDEILQLRARSARFACLSYRLSDLEDVLRFIKSGLLKATPAAIAQYRTERLQLISQIQAMLLASRTA